MVDRLHRVVVASDGLSLPVTLTAVVTLLVALVAGLVWLADGNRHKPRSAGGRHRAPRGRAELLDDDAEPEGAEELRHGPATGQ
jgi:hypothetical protein